MAQILRPLLSEPALRGAANRMMPPDATEAEATSHRQPVAGSAPRLAPTWLTDDELREAESVHVLARTHRVPSIGDAVRWYAAHAPAALSAPPVKTCIAEFLAVKAAERVRATTLHAYRHNLAMFAAEFGERQPVSITPKEMSAYLMRWPNPHTQKHRRQVLVTLFAWLIRLGHALENPVILAMPEPKLRAPERLILSPREAKRILRLARATDTIGYWVLSMFGGLRTQEIRALQKLPDPWSLVRFGTGVIELPATITKTEGRLVPLQPVLRDWLQWMKKRELPFLPANWAAKAKRIRDAALKDRITTGDRGDPRIFNIGRRSYISHRLALPGAGFAEVSDEVGNSEEIMRKYYYRRVSRGDALAYFALTPVKV